MIALDATTRKLQAFLAGAVAATNPTVTVIYYDLQQQTKTDFSEYRRAPQFTVLAGATETDVCAAPALGIVRHIEEIQVYNADTATVTVTVCVDDGGTNRILVKQALLTTETLQYQHGIGWSII